MIELTKLIVLLCVSLLALHLVKKRFRRQTHLPPGPKGLPLLGNIFRSHKDSDNRKEPIWVTYANWSRIYGDIFSFHVLGHHTVVLNSHKVITDLLEHRSYNYSDRPRQPMLQELVGQGEWAFVDMPYADRWRLHRKTFHQSFQPRVVPEYYDIQRQKTASLIRKLETSPKDFFHHVRGQAGGIILEIMYGYQIQDYDDPYVQIADDMAKGPQATGIPGTFFVDYLPMLKYLPAWFPGAGFKRRAKVWARDGYRARDVPWMDLKEKLNEGTAVPSFCTRNLEKHGISPSLSDNTVMETVIKNCAAMGFAAASDTSVSAMLSFILAMVLNPEVQARAQKELDDVIGPSRLPDFTDRESLHFINAILWETLRWRPVTPLAVAHGASNDDVYDGYFIPGGSTVIGNAWAVLHNKTLYGPNTSSFNPDRFMKADKKDLPPNPESFAFGFGRRMCPGRYLAVNTVWIAMTYLLTAFTMAKEVNEEGKEVDPVDEYVEGMLSHPLPFNCRFIPRGSTLFG